MPHHVALVEPEIPHNTGAAARLCLATGSSLHLIGRLGFRIDDKSVRRVGLDYWQHVQVARHESLDQCLQSLPGVPAYYLSTHADRDLFDEVLPAEAVFVFGRETKGLPQSLIEANADRALRIPLRDDRIRSLNLATAVGIVLYEALRQHRHGAGVAGRGKEGNAEPRMDANERG